MATAGNSETLMVLIEMLTRPEGQHHVQDISRSTEIPGTTLYAIFQQLEKKRWVLPTAQAQVGALPPQLYAFTALGLRKARQWVSNTCSPTREDTAGSLDPMDVVDAVDVVDLISGLSS